MAANSSGGHTKIAFGLAFAAAVVVPGIAKYVLSGIGYPVLGTSVWALGYGFGAIAMWAIWIRPLDLTGPDGFEKTDAGEK